MRQNTKRRRLMQVVTLGLVLLVVYASLSAVRAVADNRLAEQGVALPIIMYHSIYPDPAGQSKYVIAPQTFANDLEYLAAQGYTTVTMAQVIAFVQGRGRLPEKPIMITLDDGFYNNYVYAYPLLKQYGMQAVINVVGAYTFEPPSGSLHAKYSNLTLAQMQEMVASGVIEIQNHTYNLHQNTNGREGAAQRSGESLQQYTQLLQQDLMPLQQQLQQALGQAPTTFCYPFGAFSRNTDAILRQLGFVATLSCTEGMNYLQVGSDLYRLKRYNRPHGPTSQAFFAKATAG